MTTFICPYHDSCQQAWCKTYGGCDSDDGIAAARVLDEETSTLKQAEIRYWVEENDRISPHMKDLVGTDTDVVRVFRRSPPFALGEVVAFFVGEDADKDADVFIRAKREAGANRK